MRTALIRRGFERPPRKGRASARSGVFAWYVPEGAEFDYETPQGYQPRFRSDRRDIRRSYHYNDPWYNAWTEDVTWLEDFDLNLTPVDYDEVEEWDDLVAPKPAHRVHEGVFDDLTVPVWHVSPSVLTEAPRRAHTAAPRESDPEASAIPFTMGEIRSWAKDLGFAVPNDGRIPPEAWDAYHDMLQEAS